MAISFDKLLGFTETALTLRARRMALIASNLANADTPNYKARDIDFRAVLGSELKNSTSGKLVRTDPRHLSSAPGGSGVDAPVLYRIPLQPSLDGNTVDTQLEQAQFSENAVRYQATLRFISGRFKGMMLALKGQD